MTTINNYKTMIKVFVMQTCPDCAGIKETVKDDPRFETIDIGAHVRNLKQFLALRDSSPAFDAVKRNGSVGIPCFVLEDGSVTFSPADAHLPEPAAAVPHDEAQGSSCSIDGSGC